jgi:UDP-GlcNAc:undecaprenyl-phosphate GlcNAc-1-phosphate transferase
VPLAGALLGFLRYNFNPASIFLGDCGSLSIGFLLGCFGVIWGQKSATLLGMTAPLMALSIPLLDTALSILRRFLRHQPIFGADRNHIHHRLLDRGLSPRRVSLLLYGMCGVAAAFSLLQSRLQHKFGELIIVVFCTAAWIGILHLRYGEFGALRRLLFTGTFRDLLDTQLYMTKFEKKLAVAKTEDECWHAVQDVGKDFGFTRVRMQLGGRAYEAQLSEANPGECWTMSIPLSDTEFVDLVHRRESSVRTMIATTSLADILERLLRPRIQQTQTISDVSRDDDQPRADERLSKQPLAASGPAVESSLAAGA